MALLSLNKMRF